MSELFAIIIQERFEMFICVKTMKMNNAIESKTLVRRRFSYIKIRFNAREVFIVSTYDIYEG